MERPSRSESDPTDNPATWVVPSRKDCIEIARAATRFWEKRGMTPPTSPSTPILFGWKAKKKLPPQEPEE